MLDKLRNDKVEDILLGFINLEDILQAKYGCQITLEEKEYEFSRRKLLSFKLELLISEAYEAFQNKILTDKEVSLIMFIIRRELNLTSEEVVSICRFH